MSDERTHYEVLGVSPHASKEELRTAYQSRLAAAQPTGGGRRGPGEAEVAAARAETARINRAWQVLSDPFQRQRYDAELPVPVEPVPRGGVEGDELDELDEVGGDLELLPPPPGAESGRYAGGLELASAGRRVAAALVDVVTMAAVFLGIMALVGSVAGVDSGLPLYASVVGTAEALLIGYVLIPTARTGQSLGKRMTYIMVVDRATGRLPAPRRVLARYAVPMALFLLGQLGWTFALFFGLSWGLNRDGVSLGDRLARTAVVVARYRPERSRPADEPA